MPRRCLVHEVSSLPGYTAALHGGVKVIRKHFFWRINISAESTKVLNNSIQDTL